MHFTVQAGRELFTREVCGARDRYMPERARLAHVCGVVAAHEPHQGFVGREQGGVDHCRAPERGPDPAEQRAAALLPHRLGRAVQPAWNVYC